MTRCCRHHDAILTNSKLEKTEKNISTKLENDENDGAHKRRRQWSLRKMNLEKKKISLQRKFALIPYCNLENCKNDLVLNNYTLVVYI